MSLLAADASRALAALLGHDRGAHVALESAAALHLGRPLAAPIVVVAREVPVGGPLKRVAPSSSRPRLACVTTEGLRVAGLEATIVELCTRPTRPLAIVLAAELLRVESALERRRHDPSLLVRLARRLGTGAGQRRVAYLLRRAGYHEQARALSPEVRPGAVKLDPLGPPGGPVDARLRVRAGVADGFALGARARPWVRFAAEVLGDAANEVALRVSLGVALPLDDALVEAEARGFFRRDGELLVPRPPFDEACALVAAAVTPRRKAAILGALLRRGDPRARIDAALLEPEPPAGAGLLVDAALASAVDATRARLVLDRLGLHLARDVHVAFLTRVGRYADAAALVRRDLACARGAARAQLSLTAAQLAWRRARRREAELHLDELEGCRAPAALAIEALLLRAALAVEAGGHGRARRLLARAQRAADRAGRDLDRARVSHRLGTLEARQGRPFEAATAYRAALAILEPHRDEHRALRGILESNLAATAAWLGRWDEAERLAHAALADKRGAGTAAEVASTRVLLARIARARGDAVPPGGRVPPLLPDVERAADVRLRVEVLLDLAEELAREGDPSAAARALERARADLLVLDRAEPVLDALFLHVHGLVLGLSGERLSGEWDEAIAAIDRAARTLDRLHGAFWAARARRDAAALADAAGRPDEALARLKVVARACDERRFVLGEERTHVATTALAAACDDPALAEWAARALDRLRPLEVRARLVALGFGARADALGRRTRGEAHAPVARLVAADGRRSIDARERDRILGGLPDAFVLDEQELVLVRPGGQRVDLSRRRVLAPLLRALAQGDPQPLDRLTRTLWGRVDASARAAAKMAISRLRDLLGPGGECLVAARVRGELCYRMRAPFSLSFVEPL